MEKELGYSIIKLIQGDITDLEVDCVVNPANSSLVLGSGVAGSIREKGGSEIQKECNEIGGCPLGEAVITGGGKLKAKYVIHAVGPRYNIDPEPAKYLYAAVSNSLKLADNKQLKSIALPAISTGTFGYPVKSAAEIILKAIVDFANSGGSCLKKITVCLFSKNDLSIFEEVFQKLIQDKI